ncbi:NB-ARC domain-containing protein [Kitasatospora sp. NPDC036755]|uniref:NB-ARC domain-containing protein n=1 Tax=Kitasatospora sp. NPDC036755 TaxID=3154600 RepID=UPI0033DF3CC9
MTNVINGGTFTGTVLQGGQVTLTTAERSWPLQVGVMPAIADAFQNRGLTRTVADAAGTGEPVVLCQVLAGMGGVGKTQLAAHHAHTLLDDGSLDLLLWVTASSRQAVRQAYTQAAAQVADGDPAAFDTAPELFLAWLSTTSKRWLVVLDDVQDAGDLARLWPPRRASGQVVVTTRRRDPLWFADGRTQVEVGLFTPAEALAYLRRRLDRWCPGEGDDDLAALGEELGRLPLALAQAASFIIDSAESGMTSGHYREMVRSRLPLTELAPNSLPDDQTATLAAVLALSLERADHYSLGQATSVLQLASWLDPHGIPVRILTSPSARAFIARQARRAETAEEPAPAPRRRLLRFRRDPEPPPVPAPDISAQRVRAVLGILHRLSLADHLPAGDDRPFGMLRVHALVQHAAQDTLGPGLALFARTTAFAIQEAWPPVETSQALAQALRACTAALHRKAGRHLWADPTGRAATTLLRAGVSLADSGQSAAAVRYFEQLAMEAGAHVGFQHPTLLTIRLEHSRCLGTVGDDLAAIRGLEDVLRDMLRVHGPDHPSTLSAQAALAEQFGKAGDFATATEVYDIVANRLSHTSPRGHDTIASLANLAHWKGESGRPDAAARALRELAAHSASALGEDAPQTLAVSARAAHWLGKAGDPLSAVYLLRSLLDASRRSAGEHHPRTLAIRLDHAHWMGTVGEVAWAITDLEDLLPEMRRVLGDDHPDTVRARLDHANWLVSSGEEAQGARLLDVLATELTTALGARHPHAFEARRRSAHAAGAGGDHHGAAAAFRELHLECSAVLGEDHPRALALRQEYLEWRAQESSLDDAVAEHLAHYAETRRALGMSHPLTAAAHTALRDWQARLNDEREIVIGPARAPM